MLKTIWKIAKKQKIDILSICTPPETHYGIIKEASKYVKVIFCEKPFTTSSSEIRKIIRLKNRRGVKIAINLYRQYDSMHNNIRSLLQAKRFGKVQRINCFYGKGLSL